MDFLSLVKSRFSSRNYQEKPIEQEKILAVLEAGRVSPSAVNYQPREFIVFTEPEARTRIAQSYHRPWLATAPVIIVVCGNHQTSWKRAADQKDFCDVDAAIAIDHMTLAATSLGLATCWVCNFDPEKCRETLGVPPHLEPIAIIPLAYPADQSDPDRHDNKRKPLSEIVHWNEYQPKAQESEE